MPEGSWLNVALPFLSRVPLVSTPVSRLHRVTVRPLMVSAGLYCSTTRRVADAVAVVSFWLLSLSVEEVSSEAVSDDVEAAVCVKAVL